jgi:hypothetical protein
MYGKMTSSKMPKKDSKKGIPLTIMIAVGKPKMRPMPERGGRTTTNMMKKSSRGK